MNGTVGETKITANNDRISITGCSLNLLELTDYVTLPTSGAISVFIGTTRDNFNGRKVKTLEYECYQSMAIKELDKILTDIRLKWSDIGRIAVSHRLGVVPVTEASVVIAISSPHRKSSIEAVNYCIDTLKSTVPIWKKEQFEDGGKEWKENKECHWMAVKQERLL